MQAMQEPLIVKSIGVDLKNSDNKSIRNAVNCYNIGEKEIPFKQPNIHPDTEIEDIEKAIQNSKNSGFDGLDVACMCCLSATIAGLFCWVIPKTILINYNQYGFLTQSGRVIFLKPGFHYVGQCTMSDVVRYDISSDYIKVNNFQIIRIEQDEIGIGIDSTNQEVLLPGTHCRISGAYVFKGRYKLNQDIVDGPLKILTVKTGTVRICFDNGVAEILTEGRYAVNSNGFTVGNIVDITQQNLKFKQHKVLLEGGVNMIVEGLLTYQVVDVARLIKSVDYRAVSKYLEEIMKADLTKVFSSIHLEQISSSTYSEMKNDDSVKETRVFIYESIMKMIKPQADQWGIRIVNFQLESTQLADQKYSLDYEFASLQIAKSKAELRAQEALNAIQKLKAETQTQVQQIQAETDQQVQLIRSQANAEAMMIQAEANANAIIKQGDAEAKAAEAMKSEFGQQAALLNEKAKIANGLKIHTLVIGDGKNNSLADKVIPVLQLS